jgi:hypothetical protein
MTTVSAGVPDATASIPMTPGSHFPPIPNAIATTPLPRREDPVSPGSKGLDFDEDTSPNQPEDSQALDKSSNLVGELWLDTLSLREWLQTYLTGEMGHALQATSRFGTAFE